MPFYEYECRSCKHYVEVLQRISDAPLTKCPSCGRKTLVKLISAPVFRLKGGGWYETDFKSDKEGKRNLAGAEREETKSSESTAGETAGPAKATEGKSTEGKAETKATPAPTQADTGSKHRVTPPARRAAASAKRTGTRARAKQAPAKGAAGRRSKR